MTGKGTRSATAIRLPMDLHEELSRAAVDQGVSMNDIVTEACRFALPHMRPPEDRTLFVDPETT